MLKADLRKLYLKKREELTDDELESLSLHLMNEIFTKVDFSKINILHTFLPIERFNEVDTWSLIYRIWSTQSHVQICAPRINSDNNTLISMPLERNTQIEESKWGVAEPVGNVLVNPEQIDLVIVPMLCADKRGYRVGYGKGYYDRFLAACRENCRKLGVNLFPPIEEIADVNEFDIKVDELIYPSDTLHS